MKHFATSALDSFCLSNPQQPFVTLLYDLKATSRYLHDLLNRMLKVLTEHFTRFKWSSVKHVSFQIITESIFLNLRFSFSNSTVSPQIYDKRNNFAFDSFHIQFSDCDIRLSTLLC